MPVFSNATASDHPSQVGFSQTFGGIQTVYTIGGSACEEQVGSAWCTYPWYSYSCLTHAFNFGATDYPGVSDDFGQYLEWTQTPQNNDLDIYYYPPANFSIPACGEPTYSLAVGTTGAVPGGSVTFLSQDVSSGTYPDLLPGNYSIFPHPPAGAAFEGWITRGDVAVNGAFDDARASVEVTGDGAIYAEFTASPNLTLVAFDDLGTSGSIVLSAGALLTDGIPIGTYANGATVALSAGLYGVEALPAPGSNFTNWSTAGAGVSIDPVDFPFSLLDVSAAGGAATVAARYAASPDGATVFVQVYGDGNVTFGTNTTDNFTAVNLTVGAYPASAVPALGWAFSGWNYAPSLSMTDFAPSTNVSLENGSSWLYAYFAPVLVVVNVTLVDSPTVGGQIGLDFAPPSASASVLPTAPGNHSLQAYPEAGYAIQSWAVNDSADAGIVGAGWDPSVQINASVTITATFAPVPSGTLSFVTVPSNSAALIVFNDFGYLGGSENTSVGTGTYFVQVDAAPDWEVSNLTASGGASELTPVAGGFSVAFDGSPGKLTATVERVPIPVSFASSVPVGITLILNGTLVGVGDTDWLPEGTYPIQLAYPGAVDEFLEFSPSPGLTVASPDSASTTLTVGPFLAGTLVAILDGPPTITSFSAAPASFDLGRSTTLSVEVVGGAAPLGYSFSTLPPGCLGPGPTIPCTPTDSGDYPVAVTVSDAFNLEAKDTTLVEVNPAPVVSVFSDSPSEIDVGSTTTITTTVSGGTAPFAYDYASLPTGCATEDGAALECAPTASGLWVLGVIVTDADGETSSSAVSLTVDPAPSISSLTATRTSLDVAMTTTLDVVGSGTGDLTYSWLGLPTGCVSANVATLACTPLIPGSANLTARIVDSVGGVATARLALSIASRPSATVSVAPGVLVAGSPMWINVSAAGGTGNLSYAYAALPTGCQSSDSPSLECVPTFGGSFNTAVTVRDALHQSVNISTPLAVRGPLAPSPSSSGWTLELVAAAAAVVVAAVVLVALMVRRRRARPAPPGPAGKS